MKYFYFLLIFIMKTTVSCIHYFENFFYLGEDISTQAQIIRDKNTKQASFESKSADAWTLYAGLSVDSIDLSTPILTGKGEGSFPLDLPLDRRSYFKWVTPQGAVLLAERHLPIAGGFNFRDLGGYKTQAGRCVKWGKIIRSDDLSNLTDADLNYLSNLPLLTVIDYRSEEEIKAAADKIPSSVTTHLINSINPGNITSIALLKNMDSTKLDGYMQQINVEFVTDSHAIAQFRKVFDLLQNPTEHVSLLYHCTAGKDRTGMASALILYALGVDDKTIMEDYLLSNQFIKEKFEKYTKTYPQFNDLFIVKSEFLQAGLDQINKQYGSVDNFLTQQLKVDFEKIRNLYLY